MKSALHETFGHPPDVLCYGDMPLPIPAAGQVRIKMRLSPIHNHELWTIRGHYGFKPELPAVGGTEACGEIDALGEGVTQFRVGQRIAVAGVLGTWAEYFLAPAKTLVPLPENIDDATGAQLVAMPLSALMLLESLSLDTGQWAVQNTANGAVGKTFGLIAQARGIEVIHLVRSQAAVNELHALGFKHVVDTSLGNWKHTARALAQSNVIAAGVDSIGGKASGDLLSLLGENATLVSFGSMSGEMMEISSGDLIFKQATIKGFWASKMSGVNGKSRAELIGELIQLISNGVLTLPVEAIYSLADITAATEAALKGGRRGKVLLKP